MTFMAGVIESTGYFPDPVTNTGTSLMPANLGTHYFLPAAGGIQIICRSSPGDSITIRYAAAGLDNNLFNCLGLTNTSANIDVFTNQFFVDPATKQLKCTATSFTFRQTRFVTDDPAAGERG